jgi:hypothetical protein
MREELVLCMQVNSTKQHYIILLFKIKTSDDLVWHGLKKGFTGTASCISIFDGSYITRTILFISSFNGFNSIQFNISLLPFLIQVKRLEFSFGRNSI